MPNKKPPQPQHENILEKILDECNEITRAVNEQRRRLEQVEQLVSSVMDTVNETMTIVSRIEQKEDKEIGILDDIPTGGTIQQLS